MGCGIYLCYDANDYLDGNFPRVWEHFLIFALFLFNVKLIGLDFSLLSSLKQSCGFMAASVSKDTEF